MEDVPVAESIIIVHQDAIRTVLAIAVTPVIPQLLREVNRVVSASANLELSVALSLDHCLQGKHGPVAHEHIYSRSFDSIIVVTIK